MNILVIHEVSYLDKPVYEYQDFAERLVSRGHQVTVIDFCESKKSPQISARVSKTGLSEVQLINMANNGLPVFKYLAAKWRFPSLLKKTIKAQSVDAVLLYSVFINGTSTIRICRKLGIPVVYRVLDAYHRLRKNKFESWLLLQAERYIFRNANALSVTNNQMAEYVAELAPQGRLGTLQVTDHGVDTAHFRRIDADRAFANRLHVGEADVVCVFLGTTYAFSRLDVLVGHIRRLREHIPGFKLLVVGAGELDGAIRQAAIDADVVDHVLQPGMIAYQDLPAYLSLASCAINSFEINSITRDIVPIKMLQYLAAELPVVSTPLPDLQQKMPHETSGVFYSATDDMASFMEQLIQTVCSENLPVVGRKGREYVSHHHSMDRVISELEKLLGK